MDAGSYTINVLRFLAGEEPEVVQAVARLASPQVDRRMDVEMRFPGGISGHMTASLFSRTLLCISVRVTGDQGEMRVLNFVAPHIYHRLMVRTKQGSRTERMAGEATYTSQRRAFVQAITQGTPVPTNPAEAIANMRVIDAVYRQAGLSIRGANTTLLGVMLR